MMSAGSSLRIGNAYVNGTPRLLALDKDENVVDAGAVVGVTDTGALLHSPDLIQLLESRLAEAVTVAEAITWRPPVLAPEKLIMVGLNYRRHAEETRNPIPTTPILFGKFNNALAAHESTIELPVLQSRQFDYEAELVIVIGRQARDISVDAALDYVLGYTVGNDLSARDLQKRTSQMFIGKSLDGFAPSGPWITTTALVPDPQSLPIECRVNGRLVQSSSTSDMIFSCAEIVSYTSRFMTLKPGDMIFTGTPEGVISGKPEGERHWLKAGDEVTTSIGRLGKLTVTLTERT